MRKMALIYCFPVYCYMFTKNIILRYVFADLVYLQILSGSDFRFGLEILHEKEAELSWPILD